MHGVEVSSPTPDCQKGIFFSSLSELFPLLTALGENRLSCSRSWTLRFGSWMADGQGDSRCTVPV